MAARRRGENIEFLVWYRRHQPPALSKTLRDTLSDTRYSPRPRTAFYAARTHWYQERYNVDIESGNRAIVTIGSKRDWRI